MISICLCASIVFDLDVKIEWGFRSINFITIRVSADIVLAELLICSAIVLLPLWFLDGLDNLLHGIDKLLKLILIICIFLGISLV